MAKTKRAIKKKKATPRRRFTKSQVRRAGLAAKTPAFVATDGTHAVATPPTDDTLQTLQLVQHALAQTVIDLNSVRDQLRRLERQCSELLVHQSGMDLQIETLDATFVTLDQFEMLWLAMAARQPVSFAAKATAARRAEDAALAGAGDETMVLPAIPPRLCSLCNDPNTAGTVQETQAGVLVCATCADALTL